MGRICCHLGSRELENSIWAGKGPGRTWVGFMVPREKSVCPQHLRPPCVPKADSQPGLSLDD